MNPDSYMPFYFREFWEAVKGQPDHVSLGYLKAITHYWGHEHCAGLVDNNESLRRICEIDKADWDDAQAIIFDNEKFFTLGEDGKWHQKRCFEEWQIAKAKYELAVKRGLAGAKAKWKGHRK